MRFGFFESVQSSALGILNLSFYLFDDAVKDSCFDVHAFLLFSCERAIWRTYFQLTKFRLRITYITNSVKIFDWCERAKMEGAKGEEIFARESFPPPARSAEPSRKITFTFFVFARADFFPKRKRQFFCEASRRFAAADGGSA
jgi:hypothetical protein